MSKSKKLVSLVLAVLLVAVAVPMAALAAATTLPTADNGVITLTEDIELAATYEVTGTVTIDLNGNTITGPTDKTKSTIKVSNNGNLTIMDSSTDKTGTIKNAAGTATSSAYVIANAGTLTINSGNIISIGAGDGEIGRTTICNGISGSTAAQMTVNGGVISSDGYIAIKNDDYSTTPAVLNIVNGEVKSQANPANQAVQNWATCTISGGKIGGKVVTWQYSTAAGNTTITGGTITMDVMIASYRGQTNSAAAPELEISGENTKIEGSVGFLNVGDALGHVANTTGTITVSDKATVSGGVFNGSKGTVTVDGANVSTISNKAGGTANGTPGTAAGTGTVAVKNSVITGEIDSSVGLVTGCKDGAGNGIQDKAALNPNLKIESVVTDAPSYAKVTVSGMDEHKTYAIRLADSTSNGNMVILIVEGETSYDIYCKNGQNVWVFEYAGKAEIVEGTSQHTSLVFGTAEKKTA